MYRLYDRCIYRDTDSDTNNNLRSHHRAVSPERLALLSLTHRETLEGIHPLVDEALREGRGVVPPVALRKFKV